MMPEALALAYRYGFLPTPLSSREGIEKLPPTEGWPYIQALSEGTLSCQTSQMRER